MSTNQEKIAYLNETKELIKEAIVSKGVEVSDTDSFRSYADKINSISGASSNMGEYITELTDEPTKASLHKYIKTVPLLDTSNVTDMSYMFSGCSSIETIPLLDTSNVTNMLGMFRGCLKLIDLPTLNTSNVTNMQSMFSGCNSLNIIDLSKYNLQNVSTLESIFEDCVGLTHASLSGCNTSNIINLKCLFKECENMTSIELTNVDLSNSRQLSSMFYNCKNLISVDFSKCGDMLNITDLSSMFHGCSKLTNLNVANIDMSLITAISYFFGPETSLSYSCKSLENLQFGTNLGKGYTQQTDNYKSYSLNAKYCSNLTHNSLMSIINNVYDLNLTYDVTNGGTLYTQKLNLGTTNVAKLTAEEIAIATNKGWTVS